MKRRTFSIMALAAITVATAVQARAPTYGPGSWVLARYKGAPYWFPGVVQSADGRTVAILYDDGDREVLPTGLVKPYDWRVGSRVQCNWKGGGQWYAGTIAQLNQGAVFINYDDGDRESTTTGRCRSQ